MNRRLGLTIGLLALAALVALPALAAATTYGVDGSHSTVSFKIRHLVTNVTGHFRDFEGTIVYDAENPAGSSVEFTVQAASIDTANEDRDKHLRSPDFFDVEKFPVLTFKSTKVSKSKNGLDVTGEFSMHGVTKTITIPVEVAGPLTDPWGRTVAGFETNFTIDRKDYGIVWNKLLDAGGAVLGDEVKIHIAIEAATKPSDG